MAKWHQTKEGQQLNDAFNQLLFTYTNRLPQHYQSLVDLTNRSIDR